MTWEEADALVKELSAKEPGSMWMISSHKDQDGVWYTVQEFSLGMTVGDLHT